MVFTIEVLLLFLLFLANKMSESEYFLIESLILLGG